MARSMTFGQLLRVCLEHGKDTVVTRLDAYHRQLEEMQAYLYGGDSAEVRQAARMTAALTQQAITLDRLKRMTEDDMRALLRKSTT